LTKLNLDFGACAVGNEGWVAVAQHLPRALKDIRLVLFASLISDDGMHVLARSLPSSLTILRLDVCACDFIGDDWIRALAQHLPAMLTVFELDASACDLGPLCAQDLAEHLPAGLIELSLNQHEVALPLPEELEPRCEALWRRLRVDNVNNIVGV